MSSGFPAKNDELRHAFLHDHQQLTRGLAAIGEALRSNRTSEASELARALDRAVGAHIEFEETVYYPALERELGGTFVSQLYEEHAHGKQALRTLVSLGPAGQIGADERAELAKQIDKMLEHALSCGTLLSHLDSLDPARHEQLLGKLRALSQTPKRWTDLNETRTGRKRAE
jgi:DNA-binding PadR family transcriptional regulator